MIEREGETKGGREREGERQRERERERERETDRQKEREREGGGKFKIVKDNYSIGNIHNYKVIN